MNDNLENKEILEKLVKKYQIRKMIKSNYHSQNNEMIEKNHEFLFDALCKISDEELEN